MPVTTLPQAGTDSADPANPSAWSHRLPVVVLALLGCAVSTYLTAYQWHITSTGWDPIFGPTSSQAVLTSFVSRYLPLPDATLGALAYVVEAVMTAIGDTHRWRTQPWVVILYGLRSAQASGRSLLVGSRARLRLGRGCCRPGVRGQTRPL